MGKTLFSMRKGLDDQYHLIGKFSNRWRDWDFHADPLNGGEIVSKASHREYERWLDKNTQHAPQLMTWHTWGTERKSRARWWAFSDNFFYMDWPLTEDEFEAIEAWSKEEELGMSFGFYVFDYEYGKGIINLYRMFEGSVLPVESAANNWTSISLIAPPETAGDSSIKENSKMAISKKKREALVKLHGEDFTRTLEAADAELAAVLDEAGVETKEEVVVEAEIVAAASEAADETEAPSVDIDALRLEVLDALHRLEEALGKDVRTIADRLAALEARQAKSEAQIEAEAKAMATPPSILAAYSPKSILESESVAAPARQSQGSAVIDGRSTLARSAPAAPTSNGGGAIGTFLAGIGN